jgi:hypothetical protein
MWEWNIRARIVTRRLVLHLCNCYEIKTYLKRMVIKCITRCCGKYISSPVFFVRITLPGDRRRNIALTRCKWLAPRALHWNISPATKHCLSCRWCNHVWVVSRQFCRRVGVATTHPFTLLLLSVFVFTNRLHYITSSDKQYFQKSTKAVRDFRWGQ